MATLSPRDQAYLEDLLQMQGGYVLNFSNFTFAQFIATTLGVDIWEDRFNYQSGSKANRMRALWSEESDEVVGRLILELLSYIDTQVALEHLSADAFKPRVLDECGHIAHRLLSNVSAGAEQGSTQELDSFLAAEFEHLGAAVADLEGDIKDIILYRLNEIQAILNIAPLATIFLIGSTLEGILLDVAKTDPKRFIAADAAPKDGGEVRPIDSWRLASLIDVSYELGFVDEDVKRFSHSLRDFRNFIHPRAQARSTFRPTADTARICLQVLRAAVTQVNEGMRDYR